MSWIHSYSSEDFTFFLTCSAEYELIYKTVGRMEWRLNDFLSDGLLSAFENTLAARSREVGKEIDDVVRKEDLPPELTQILDKHDEMLRDCLSSVIANSNSQLLKSRLGKVVLPAHENQTIDKGLAKLMLQQQLQHMSRDDPSFHMIFAFSQILRFIHDLNNAKSGVGFFKKVKNVASFKKRINDLQRSCEIDKGVIEEWVRVVMSHAITSCHRTYKHIAAKHLLEIWAKIFKCLGFISNSLHGLIILSEADAHGDWDRERQESWLKRLDERFEMACSILEELLYKKARWALASLSLEIV